ncbi:prenyltransferase [Companilactobacillus baiquanensis]|uniref:Prenyltransferase n=1 Tax=Companilactobacillus baiquanensis TaxID=2486005 RepID=A0ABW1UUJ6_9LACO|nr:prenyltransferase [Companilactobacillus baiquanensis]
MNRKLFVELSEIRTTVLDFAWLVLAASYSYLNIGRFDIINGILGFITVFFIHIIINFHNNYMDFRHSKSEEYRKKISTIGVNRESLVIVKKWMYGLTIFPLLIGAFLVYRTNWWTLLIGIICVLIGLSYSAGPKPLNSTMFGSSVVAIAISILIPVVYVYLGTVTSGKLTSSAIINAIIVCLPNTFAMFSAQLCNDTCDLEADKKNGRHTLVTKIGKTNALSLFKASWWLTFLLIPILAVLKVVPYITMIAVLLYPNIWDNYHPYLKEQVKKKTYPLVMKAVVKLVNTYVFLVAVGAIIKLVKAIL